jgi:hypothetical protein
MEGGWNWFRIVFNDGLCISGAETWYDITKELQTEDSRI